MNSPMRLADWLKQNNVSRVDFARRIGVSPGSITQLCNYETAWMTRETAALIARETRGAVTPNDFLAFAREDHAMPHSVTEAIEALKRGEIIIVTDDDDRENEGDLICAAAHCTPEKMAFIIRHTCGIVCAPLTLAEARRLTSRRWSPPTMRRSARHSPSRSMCVMGSRPAFRPSSARNTVRALANANMGAADFVRPGHVFPLIAREGGVSCAPVIRKRRSISAASPGLPPVGVICELANDDGTVKRGDQIEAFAVEHGLKRISVADLIAYRQAREKLVERVATFPVETEFGELTGYAYSTPFDSVHHFAFVHGDIGEGKGVLIRLHRANVIARHVRRRAEHPASRSERFRAAGSGVLVYLRDGTAGVPVQSLDNAAIGVQIRPPEAMARSGPRRPDPARSRRILDRQSLLDAPLLCRAGRVRHRDRRHGTAGGRKPRRLHAPRISVITCAPTERARPSRS